jgi:hypothetical protein
MSQDPVVGLFLSFEKSHSLSSKGRATSHGTAKQGARSHYHGRKAPKLNFHLAASDLGTTSVKDAAADGNSAPRTNRTRRRSKQKPTSSSVHATTVPPVKVAPDIRVPPSTSASNVASAEVPDCDLADDSTTPSAESQRSYVSAARSSSSRNVTTPTPAGGTVHAPSTPTWQKCKSRRPKKTKHESPVPPMEPSAPREPNVSSIPTATKNQTSDDDADSMESEADGRSSVYRYLSEIASLKLELAQQKSELADQKALLAQFLGTSAAASSDAPAISGSPDPPVLSSDTDSANAASESNADAPAEAVADTDESTVASPPRRPHRESVLAHSPPFLPRVPKRHRFQDAVSTGNRYEPLAESTGEEEDDDMVDLTAAAEKNLNLEPVPRSSHDESGMPL